MPPELTLGVCDGLLPGYPKKEGPRGTNSCVSCGSCFRDVVDHAAPKYTGPGRAG